ncbi:outer membrane protein assembly factor BamB family protein [Halocatena salina]|uniref:PQQ-binding-like beta-propeller repeat protein n=1 Tax=Halocatena salina TaxID=2934340 RepID=A0A8U0A4C0_9EURY|nr:PQQ-binding-like beta-propeller repeat protein [Halocatena salina]UPM43308.1 PQQ-binding-like beta-propeller repeat protein [Halocatena salina]
MVSRRVFLSGGGGVLTAVLAGCLNSDNSSLAPGTDTSTDWPYPRADTANTGYVPDAKAPRESVRERWTVGRETATGIPAIVDERIYLPTAGMLLALDAESGNELWRFTLPEARDPSSPIVYDGRVYMTSEKRLYALDPATGTSHWSYGADGHEYTTLTVVAGEGVPTPHLIAGTTSGTIVAVALQTGDEMWQKDLSSAISAFGFRSFVLYVGTDEGTVYAFYWKETDTFPHEAWRSTVDGAIGTTIPSSDGVAVHTTDDSLSLLQGGESNGTTLWTIDRKLARVAPIYTNPTFYTAGTQGITAIREYNEQTDWQIDGRYDAVAPVAAGDTLYLSSGDTVHAFAADGGFGIGSIRTGAKRWSHSTSSTVQGLAIANGALFVACEGSDQTLYCLEAA